MSVFGDGHVMCHCVSFLVAAGNSFGATYELTVQQRRNRHLEGRDDGQMTFLNFNSYIQHLHLIVFQTDGRTEKLIRGGFRNLSAPPG